MVFIGRFKLIADKPGHNGRFYLHSAGLKECFGNIIEARDYVSRFIDTHDHILRNYSYVLGAVWGDVKYGDKVIDLFGCKLDDWSDNPDVLPYTFKNGIYRSYSPSVYCGDTLILLGKEEEFRRAKKSLEDYIFYNPDLGGLFTGGHGDFFL